MAPRTRLAPTIDPVKTEASGVTTTPSLPGVQVHVTAAADQAAASAAAADADRIAAEAAAAAAAADAAAADADRIAAAADAAAADADRIAAETARTQAQGHATTAGTQAGLAAADAAAADADRIAAANSAAAAAADAAAADADRIAAETARTQAQAAASSIIGDAILWYTHDASSAANAIVLADNGFNPAAPFDGQVVRFRVANAPTGAGVTLRVLPHPTPLNLLMGGFNIVSGAMGVGDRVTAMYNAAGGDWRILHIGMSAPTPHSLGLLKSANIGETRTLLNIPGTVVRHAVGTYTANANLAGTIPLDDTIPAISEGVEVISLAHACLDTSHEVFLEFMGQASAASAIGIIAALFRVGDSNALEASINDVSAGGRSQVHCNARFAPASTSSVTYTARVGTGDGSTIRLNGSTSARYFGGRSVTRLKLTEFIP